MEFLLHLQLLKKIWPVYGERNNFQSNNKVRLGRLGNQKFSLGKHVSFANNQCYFYCTKACTLTMFACCYNTLTWPCSNIKNSNVIIAEAGVFVTKNQNNIKPLALCFSALGIGKLTASTFND